MPSIQVLLSRTFGTFRTFYWLTYRLLRVLGLQREQGPTDDTVQAFAGLFDSLHERHGVRIKPYLMLLPSCLLALLPQALHPLVPLCQVGWHFPPLSWGMLPKAAGEETAPPCR